MISLANLLRRNNTLTVLYNTLAQYASKFVVLGLTLVTTALITRSLGVENYGKYSIISTFISFALILNDGGLPTIVTREGAKNPQLLKEYINTVLIGRTLLSIPFYLLTVAVALVLYSHDEVVLIGIAIMGLTLLFNAVASTVGVIFQVKLRLDIPAGIEVATRVLSTVPTIYIATHNGGVIPLIWVTVFASLTAMIFALIAARRYHTFALTFNRKLFTRLLKTSIPLGLALFVNSIYFKVDAIVLSLIKGSYDVGIYGIAYRVLEISLWFPSLFAAATIPILSRHSENREAFANALNKGFKFILVLFMPITIGGILTANNLVSLLGGSSFNEAAAPLRILLVAGLVTSFNILLGIAIIVLNQQAKTLWLNLGSLVVNVLLNVALVPKYGYMAAASLSLVSETLVLLASSMYLAKKYGYVMKNLQLFRVLLCGGLMGVATLPLQRFGVFVVIPIAAAVYCICILLFRVVTKEDLKELTSPK